MRRKFVAAGRSTGGRMLRDDPGTYPLDEVGPTRGRSAGGAGAGVGAASGPSAATVIAGGAFASWQKKTGGGRTS